MKQNTSFTFLKSCLHIKKQDVHNFYAVLTQHNLITQFEGNLAKLLGLFSLRQVLQKCVLFVWFFCVNMMTESIGLRARAGSVLQLFHIVAVVTSVCKVKKPDLSVIAQVVEH